MAVVAYNRRHADFISSSCFVGKYSANGMTSIIIPDEKS